MAVPSASFSRLRTQGLAGYSLDWSPFYPEKLAIAGSANVSGCVFLLNQDEILMMTLSLFFSMDW